MASTAPSILTSERATGNLDVHRYGRRHVLPMIRLCFRSLAAINRNRKQTQLGDSPPSWPARYSFGGGTPGWRLSRAAVPAVALHPMCRAELKSKSAMWHQLPIRLPVVARHDALHKLVEERNCECRVAMGRAPVHICIRPSKPNA
jgi:hypothetical protein